MEQLEYMIIKLKKDELEKVDEKILLISIAGTLETIKCNAITIDEAEKFLFSPHMVEVLRNKRCNERIVDIIEKACELEDIYSLIPEKLNEIIIEMQQEVFMLIKSYEEYNKIFWLD